MLKHRFLPALALAAFTLGAAPALAGDGGWLDDANFSGNVSIASDYVFRGISQTNSNPAVQGGFDYASPVGLYVGAWASNVAFGGSIEMDWYGGFASEVAGLSYDLGVIYYAYPKSHDDPEFNFFEGYLKLGYALPALGPVEPSLGAGYAYSPDFFGEDGKAHYLNGSLSLGLPYGLGLAAEVGWQKVEGDKSTGDGNGLDGDDGFDYVHYRFGAWTSLKGFDLDVSYHNTTEATFLGRSIADDRVVFTVSRSL